MRELTDERQTMNFPAQPFCRTEPRSFYRIVTDSFVNQFVAVVNRFVAVRLDHFLLVLLAFVLIANPSAMADPPPAVEAPPEKASPNEPESTLSPKSSIAEPSTAATGWKPIDGKWKTCQFGGEGEVKITKLDVNDPKSHISDKLLTLQYGDPLTGVRWVGEFPTNNYEIALQARRTDGFDFFLGLTFPIDEASVTLVLGGWGGGITGISSIDHRDASENETTMFQRYENNQWYDVRVRVDPFGIACWVDSDQVVEVDRGEHEFGLRAEMELCEPLGLAAFQSVSEYRNVRFRKLTEKEIAAAIAKKKEWEEEE